jgi:hypothetical protein
MAIVATFHVCGLSSTTRYALDFAAVYAASDDNSSSTDEVVAEKCHFCAVASAEVPSFAEVIQPDHGHVQAANMARLVSIHPQATAPPPRA